MQFPYLYTWGTAGCINNIVLYSRTTRTTAVRGGGNRKGIKRLSGISHIHKSTSTAGAYAQNVLRAVLSGFKIENGE